MQEVCGMKEHGGMAAGSRFLTEVEVSELTGLSVSTLRNWRCLNKGPRYMRPGGRAIRYAISDVEKFMLASAVQTEPCSVSCRCGGGK
jgi:predicted DNA-binding transcriptional regulator AlpA